MPTPLPLAFILKYHMQGLGVAIKTEIPSFSMKSMYQALMADNPELLESGVDLILDKSRSDLRGLWETGRGRVTYSYRLQKVTGDDGKSEGILFHGDTGVFQVKLGRKLKKLLEDGKISVDNVSDQGGPKMLMDLFTKTIMSNKHVRHLQARRLHIHRPADDAIHFDGDPTVMGPDIDINIVPRGLTAIINPKHLEDKPKPNRVVNALNHMLSK